MFLRPFGLYCSACFGSLFVSILCTCLIIDVLLLLLLQQLRVSATALPNAPTLSRELADTTQPI
jgi:hypothetical protein